MMCPYLAMGDDIAPSALQVFCEHNCFRLLGNRTNTGILCPPLKYRTHVRAISINLILSKEGLDLVENFATGGRGFTNLQHVAVRFLWLSACHRHGLSPTTQDLDLLLTELPTRLISFSCAGSVEVYSPSYHGFAQRQLDSSLELNVIEALEKDELVKAFKAALHFRD
jgi:hypothetical protein